MSRILIVFLITWINSLSYCQSYNLCYEPIKKDINNGVWDSLDVHLDAMYLNHSDSLIVPFTLNRIGDELFEAQDFDRLYKYSKLMLSYDHINLKTKFPESSNKKWDAYCRSLAKGRIHGWGHFYLASSYLNMNNYDSCLLHLDSSSIFNYSSIPRRYTYNLSAGIHLTMMKSLCLEGKGQIEEARKVLLPYLFLDSFPEVKNFYTHSDLLNQYFHLIQKSKFDLSGTFDVNNVFVIEEKKKPEYGFHSTDYSIYNDSIISPSGWNTYQRSPIGSYIMVEDVYVVIRVNPMYYLALGDSSSFSLPVYLKQTEFYRSLNQK